MRPARASKALGRRMSVFEFAPALASAIAGLALALSIMREWLRSR